MAARSPLFAALRRAAAQAGASSRPGAAPLDELLDSRISRRDMLRGFVGYGAAALASACTPALPVLGHVAGRGGLGASGAAPRVAIVGAGLAGLSALHALTKAGVSAVAYEASSRVGGRVRTAHDLAGPGLVTELGAEFIDSGHKSVIALARELGLRLHDAYAGETLEAEIYHVGGRAYTNADLARAVKPLLPRLARDQASLPARYTYDKPGAWAALDRLDAATYLDQVGVTGWLRQVFELAFLTEFGRELADQSALNVIAMVGTKVGPHGYELLGESDERFKIAGGNQRLAQTLAARLGDRVRLGRRLMAVAPRGEGYRLTFAEAGGPTHEVEADVVILALPFTLLRDVEVSVPLPAAKRRAINELGYGANAKLLLPFKKRVWRDAGSAGSFFADAGLQCGWDHTMGQPGPAGGLTLYLGGREGAALGEGTPQEQAAKRLPALDRVFPGAKAAFTGEAQRAHWPSNPWSRGSYACYGPGQNAAFRGAEGEPVGRLLFAGEHCSLDQQSFMEGAVETGLSAARLAVRAMRPA